MDKSSYYFLVSVLFLAPHLSGWLSVTLGSVYMVLALIAGIFDVKHLMQNESSHINGVN